jgi:hypothetical protein
MSWAIIFCISAGMFAILTLGYNSLLHRTNKDYRRQNRELSSRISEVSAENIVYIEAMTRLRTRLAGLEADQARLATINKTTNWKALLQAVEEYMAKQETDKQEINIENINRFRKLLPDG